MVYCVAYNCKNRKGDPKMDPKTSFHRFPKDLDRRVLWAERVRRENWVANDKSCLCSKHFLFSCFEPTTEYGTRRRLKKDAVPTLFDYTPRRKSMKKKLKKLSIEENQALLAEENKLLDPLPLVYGNIKEVELDHNYCADLMSLSRRVKVITAEKEKLSEQLRQSRKHFRLMQKRYKLSRRDFHVMQRKYHNVKSFLVRLKNIRTAQKRALADRSNKNSSIV